MKASEPCPWCNLPRRYGEGCYIVHVKKDDPSGRAPGKYTVCAACAGFDYVDVPGPLTVGPKRDFDYCPTCHRAYARNTIRQRLRLTKQEHEEFGLPECEGWGPAGAQLVMCSACFEKYAPTVRERLGLAESEIGNRLM